ILRCNELRRWSVGDRCAGHRLIVIYRTMFMRCRWIPRCGVGRVYSCWLKSRDTITSGMQGRCVGIIRLERRTLKYISPLGVDGIVRVHSVHLPCLADVNGPRTQALVGHEDLLSVTVPPSNVAVHVQVDTVVEIGDERRE